MAGTSLQCECDKGSTKLPLWPVTGDGFSRRQVQPLKVQIPLQRDLSLLTEGRGIPGHPNTRNRVQGTFSSAEKKINQMVLVGSKQSGHQI